jgi:hypothetical protein
LSAVKIAAVELDTVVISVGGSWTDEKLKMSVDFLNFTFQLRPLLL